MNRRSRALRFARATWDQWLLGVLVTGWWALGIVFGSGCGERAPTKREPRTCEDLGQMAYGECRQSDPQYRATHEDCERWANDVTRGCHEQEKGGRR